MKILFVFDCVGHYENIICVCLCGALCRPCQWMSVCGIMEALLVVDCVRHYVDHVSGCLCGALWRHCQWLFVCGIMFIM